MYFDKILVNCHGSLYKREPNLQRSAQHSTAIHFGWLQWRGFPYFLQEGYSKEDYRGKRVNLFHNKLHVSETDVTYFLSLSYVGNDSDKTNTI